MAPDTLTVGYSDNANAITLWDKSHGVKGKMPLEPALSSKWLSQEEIAERFAELLRRLDWGPTEAARELGADQGDVSRWKSGKRPIPRGVLEKIANAAGVTEAFFIRSDDPGDPARRDKLAVLQWLRSQADQISEDLKSPEDAGLRAAERARRKVPRRPRKRVSGDPGDPRP